MRHLFTLLALPIAASTAIAHPPARRGPPIDLVAAPPVVPTPALFPIWNVPYWGGFYSNPYYPGLFPQPPVVIVPAPVPIVPVVNPARIAEDTDRAAADVPATLTLQLPVAADVWLDGEKQPSSTDTTRTLLSTPMKLGAEYTFRIRARWGEGGTTYEAAPTSTVRAGERGKLTVYAGTPVK